MLPETERRFNDTILAEAAHRYGQAKDGLTNLGGFESFVYEFQRGGRPYILKITHSIRRAAPYILGELDFVNYLASGGVSVARAIRSDNGNLIETIPADDDTHFLVYAFEKAEGARATRAYASTALWESWGWTLGRMHALTKRYTLPDPSYKRQEWHQDDLFDLRKHLPASSLRDRCQQFIESLHGLPQGPDAYGLVHADLHPGNFFLHEGRITAFDFDDSQYHWFAADLAIALYNMDYFAPQEASEQEKSTFLHQLAEHFLRGYYRENHLDPLWLPRIRDFWKLRSITYYALIHREWGVANLNEQLRNWFDALTTELESDAPHHDIDFEPFATMFAPS
jgi:Ser/Thr protein kinase RdoA (MazF antagonist)